MKRIVGPLDKAGLLSTLDRGILAAYCTSWEMCVALRRLLAEEGTVIVGERSKEPVKHPAWSQLQQATALQIKLARELGLTPGSRLRMPNPLFDPDPDLDELEQLLS